jgi:hypothetical protein
MGTNENPPMDLATDVNDNATINTGGAKRQERIRDADTDKDPDLTGKDMDPAHDTLTYGNRDASGRIRDDATKNPADRAVSSNQSVGSRGDAARGPTAQPSDSPPKT